MLHFSNIYERKNIFIGGFYMGAKLELTGQKFNHLLVLEEVPKD